MFSACKKDTYVPIVGTCPVVASTSPTDGTVNVPLNKVITATFNEKMNATTITQSSFSITGVTKVDGNISYDAATFTASFSPNNPLLLNTTYTGRITSTVKDWMGNAVQADYIWTFSTGPTITPMVITTDPVNNATAVFINKTIAAGFNTPMDPNTITASTYTIKEGTNTVAGTISYSGNTAYFSPSANLKLNTLYTGTVTTGAQNTSGMAMPNGYTWHFTTGSTIAPTVVSTDPLNNAINVPINKTITATFSTAMNPTTISATTFIVKQGTTPVAGLISYSGLAASFAPTGGLISGNTYTATITNGAQSTTGTALVNNYTWIFTTVSPAPLVISTSPTNNEMGVLLDKVIAATFNVSMDPLSINTTTFSIKQGLLPVSGTVSYTGKTASFRPLINLLPGTIYTGIISTGVKNVAGMPIASNYTWNFTTLSAAGPYVTSTDPANKDADVVLNKIVTASFNMAMDPLTISTATFTLKLGTASVPGAVSYSGTKATFTPTSNLLSDNTYTATITKGAKNIAGTPLVNDYIWEFSTRAHTGPQAPDLKSVMQFGIISGVGVSNNAGFSVINDMNVGIYPGFRSAITGFPPAKVVNGNIYAADDLLPVGVTAMLKQAKVDLTDAYNYAKGASSPAPVTVSGDQGGKTLAPGIYTSTSTLGISSGDLTLDAKGDANAIWIFQIASGFTTTGGSGGNVILSGGAQANNVYWQVGSSATIGDNTSFKGNILALTSITMNSKAVAAGRMLAINAAVVMTSTNTINKP